MRTVMVDESIDAARLGSGEVTERLLAIAARDYRTIAASSDRLQFSRSRRPLWALVVGIALIPVIIGIFILFIRTTETWTATIESDHRSVRLRIRGTILPRTLVELRQTMATPSERLLRPLDQGLVADPILTPPSAQPSFTPLTEAPSHHYQATTPAAEPWPPPPVDPPARQELAPPVPASSSADEVAPPTMSQQVVDAPGFGNVDGRDVASADSGETVAALDRERVGMPSGTGESDRTDDSRPMSPDSDSDSSEDFDQHTVLRSELTRLQGERLDNESSSNDRDSIEMVYVVRFDTGRVEAVERFALVGRDPTVRKNDPPAKLIAIADPSMSISKTHLALEVIDGTLFMTDRGSKNGVTIDLPSPSVKLEAERRYEVPRNAVVSFGGRTFSVEMSTSDVAVQT